MLIFSWQHSCLSARTVIIVDPFGYRDFYIGHVELLMSSSYEWFPEYALFLLIWSCLLKWVLKIGLPIPDRLAVCVEVCWLCPEEYADLGVEVDSSGNLLVAHTEALCTSRVGGSRRSPVLVPRDLKRPLKISTQKIQNTLTSRSEHSWKCRSAGVLPREECIF